MIASHVYARHRPFSTAYSRNNEKICLPNKMRRRGRYRRLWIDSWAVSRDHFHLDKYLSLETATVARTRANISSEIIRLDLKISSQVNSYHLSFIIFVFFLLFCICSRRWCALHQTFADGPNDIVPQNPHIILNHTLLRIIFHSRWKLFNRDLLSVRNCHRVGAKTISRPSRARAQNWKTVNVVLSAYKFRQQNA